MDTYAEFKPRSQDVIVGKETLIVKEYSIAKRDAIFGVVLAAIDVVPLIQPFIDGVQELRKQLGTKKKDEELSIDMGGLAGQLLEVVKKLLTKDLSRISCLTLDIMENRVGTGMKLDEKLETDGEHGFEYSPGMFRWIKDNLTQRQEQAVLEAVFRVNDFVGLIKNYSTLVVSNIRAARAAEPEEKKEGMATPITTPSST